MGYIGKKGLVILYKAESTYGTKATPANPFGEIDDFTAPTESRSLDTKPQLGSTAPAYFEEDVQKYTGGQIKVKVLRPEFLVYILGASTDSGVGPYTHTMGLDSTIASLTIGVSAVDATGAVVTNDYYVGCLFKSVQIDAKKGQPITAIINFDCQAVDSDSSTALVFATQTGESPMLFSGASVSVGGTTINTVTEFTLTLNRKLDRTDVLNNLVNAYQSIAEFDGKLDLTYAYTQGTEAAYYRGSSAGTQNTAAPVESIVVTVTNGLATTSLRSWAFTMTTSKFGEFKFAGFGDHRLASLMAIPLTLSTVCSDNTATWTQ
jgi:hypothetical protein